MDRPPLTAKVAEVGRAVLGALYWARCVGRHGRASWTADDTTVEVAPLLLYGRPLPATEAMWFVCPCVTD